MGHIPRLLRHKDIIELSSKYPAACGEVLHSDKADVKFIHANEQTFLWSSLWSNYYNPLKSNQLVLRNHFWSKPQTSDKKKGRF